MTHRYPTAIFNWSTGKDSALALHRVLQSGEYNVGWLLTTVNARYDRVSMHGVRTDLLEAQAASLGIPLVQVRLPDTPTMDAYECAMHETLGRLCDEGATVSIFGDIFLEDLRVYREKQMPNSGLQAVFSSVADPDRDPGARGHRSRLHGYYYLRECTVSGPEFRRTCL